MMVSHYEEIAIANDGDMTSEAGGGKRMCLSYNTAIRPRMQDTESAERFNRETIGNSALGEQDWK